MAATCLTCIYFKQRDCYATQSTAGALRSTMLYYYEELPLTAQYLQLLHHSIVAILAGSASYNLII